MPSLVDKAERYATQAHQRIRHTRKYNGQPYDVHLRAVAQIVASVTDDEQAIAAAWLHDIVEDTPATQQDVEREFGTEVAALVSDLTDVSRPSDGNRSTRKAIDRRHLAGASPRAKTVKLADLIDNCLDITKHDFRFARVFLDEMAQTLEVLEDGDASLYARAWKTHEKCVLSLAVDASLGDDGIDALDRPADRNRIHVSRLFVEAFTAGEIARPLRSFDAERDARQALESMQDPEADVVGVRVDGAIAGYLYAADPGVTSCGEAMRAFSPGQVLHGSAPLSDVIHVLTRHSSCFVTTMGEVTGVIDRDDINDPIVRMWLFGIITILEMEMTRLVRANYPQEAWRAKLPEARIRKAEELFAERRRRNRSGTLLDCLQLPDKALILIRDGAAPHLFPFDSTRTARRAIKDIESLRNHLAHAQDIVAHDWAQIARLASRIEEATGLRSSERSNL